MKYRRSKRTYKKKTAKKLVTVSTVRKMIGKKLEHKVSDVTLYTLGNPTPVNSAGVLFLLNGITQGVNQSNRVSNELIMKKLEMKIELIYADPTNIMRVIIVIDKQVNGVLPAVTDILQFSDATSPYNEDNKKRFRFMFDRTYTLSQVWEPNRSIKRNVLMKNYTVYYTGAGAAIANIKSNACYLLTISDSGAVSHPTIQGYIRLIYTDS